MEEIDENTSMEDLQKMMAVALVYRVLVCAYEVGVSAGQVTLFSLIWDLFLFFGLQKFKFVGVVPCVAAVAKLVLVSIADLKLFS